MLFLISTPLFLTGKHFDYIGNANLYPGKSLPDCSMTDAIITGTQAMYAGTVQEIYVTLKAPTVLKLMVSYFLFPPRKKCTIKVLEELKYTNS